MGERGQAAIEAALVMPVMVLGVLGILQLALLQQARLFTEYAAYGAARAGSVWNGSGERMHDAALFSLLPVLGRTDTVETLGRTWLQAQRDDARFHALLSGPVPVPDVFREAGLLGMVRVDALSPSGAGFAEEQEFDDLSADPRASLLTVRVRFLCELKIPIANALLFATWFAANAGLGVVHREGLPSASTQDLGVLRALASGEVKRFFIPLSATRSQRMQSSFHRKWAMHAEGR